MLGCDAEGLIAGVSVEAPIGHVVNRLVQVAVDDDLHPEGDRQIVERLPAVWVPAQALVRHEDVGTLTGEALVLVGEDRRPVAAWQAAAPALCGADDLEAIAGAPVSRLQRRRPDALAEDPAKTGDPQPCDLDDAAVEIAMGELGAE